MPRVERETGRSADGIIYDPRRVARSIGALWTPVDISRKLGSARARDIGDIGLISRYGE